MDASAEESFLALARDLKSGRLDDAARQLLARFGRPLVALAASRLSAQLRQKEDAEDVVQSVYRSFFARQEQGAFELRDWGGLWSLLTLLTLRKCARRAERYGAQKRAVNREAASADVWGALSREPTPEQAATLTETLEGLMAPLGEREREMLALRLEGCPDREIARRVGRSLYTTQTALRRVEKRLQRMLDDDSIE